MRALTLALLFLLGAASCTSSPLYVWDDSNTRPFSSLVEVNGVLYLAGKIGTDRSSFAAEVNSSIDRIEAALQDEGLDLSNLIYCTVFLTDMGRYDELNKIYGARLSHPYPGRTCVAVKELPTGAQIEIKAIAARR